jgi:hypothetical protein
MERMKSLIALAITVAIIGDFVLGSKYGYEVGVREPRTRSTWHYDYVKPVSTPPVVNWSKWCPVINRGDDWFYDYRLVQWRTNLDTGLAEMRIVPQ